MHIKYFVIAVMLFAVKLSCAQEHIGVYFNQNYTSFRFKDSDRNKNDLALSVLYGYGVTYRKQFDNGVFIQPEFQYENKGANSIFNDTHLNWSLHYLGLCYSGGYTFEINKLEPYAGLGLYTHLLFKANQTIGDKYYDLLADNTLKKIDFGIAPFVGIRYLFADYGNIFFELRENIGLQNLEKDSSTQKLFNQNFNVRIGLTFIIN